uniref:Uncharacterized protein n=1 Tax=Micrurus paraensis TaxID=1970185 RepID=A0A2D4KYQ8_9SAUR
MIDHCKCEVEYLRSDKQKSNLVLFLSSAQKLLSCCHESFSSDHAHTVECRLHFGDWLGTLEFGKHILGRLTKLEHGEQQNSNLAEGKREKILSTFDPAR